MSSNDQPAAEDREFLESQGLQEVEPGRWIGGLETSDPGMQEFLDDLSDADRETLDLMMRSGRVVNEFELGQSGADTAVHTQAVDGLFADHSEAELAVYVGIRPDSEERFTTLDGEAIETALDAMFDQYETMLPPDALAASLRQLGIKCKTVGENPIDVGTYGAPDPRDYPGFRLAVMHFPGSHRFWLDGGQ